MHRQGLITGKLHMNPTDSKLYYKIALTYMNEEQWAKCYKTT